GTAGNHYGAIWGPAPAGLAPASQAVSFAAPPPSALPSPPLGSPARGRGRSTKNPSPPIAFFADVLTLLYSPSSRARPGRTAPQPGSHPQQGPDETPGHLLEVVTPLENHNILMQINLVHSPERPQEVAQPRPDPFRRVVVHLANPYDGRRARL